MAVIFQCDKCDKIFAKDLYEVCRNVLDKIDPEHKDPMFDRCPDIKIPLSTLNNYRTAPEFAKKGENDKIVSKSLKASVDEIS